MVSTSSVQYQRLATAATHDRRWRLDATVVVVAAVVARTQQIVRAEHQGFDFVVIVIVRVVIVAVHPQDRIGVPVDDVRCFVEFVQLVHA